MRSSSISDSSNVRLSAIGSFLSGMGQGLRGKGWGAGALLGRCPRLSYFAPSGLRTAPRSGAPKGRPGVAWGNAPGRTPPARHEDSGASPLDTADDLPVPDDGHQPVAGPDLV